MSFSPRKELTGYEITKIDDIDSENFRSTLVLLHYDVLIQITIMLINIRLNCFTRSVNGRGVCWLVISSGSGSIKWSQAKNNIWYYMTNLPSQGADTPAGGISV